MTEGKRLVRRYFIKGEGDMDICWFDDLLTAALVLRFLRGATLRSEDFDAAESALRTFDAIREAETEVKK